jgi:formylglycine-generating enzyme
MFHRVTTGLFLSIVPAALLSLGGCRPSNNVDVDVFTMGAGHTSLEFVTVGDPGNAADTQVMVDCSSGHGSVAYTYKIGKYDVTAAQYCRFLNAVAATDTYNLYNSYMADAENPCLGCGIIQEGSSGSYTYTVTPGRENYPVNYVSWGDAARFVNWLSNGQPIGPQGDGTTETGTYSLSGATTDTDLLAATRNAGATYVLPTEDEWYKAAYYKSAGTDAGYWIYPTRSDTVPSNVLSATGTNNANYLSADYTDPATCLTEVGYFAHSPGPYGTFDQGGNVWQWIETGFSGADYWTRCVRGGAFYSMNADLQAYARYAEPPTHEGVEQGFRVAEIP